MPKENTSVALSDVVTISPYYQRSVLINNDLDSSDAIAGYVCHETAKKLLESMAYQIAHGNQRAFTWTGPFGTGKSILSLALASAISGDKKQRDSASKLLDVESIKEFGSAFSTTSKGWLILPVVGTNTSASKVLSEALFKATGIRSDSSSELLKNIAELVESTRFDGVLLVIDEMGKFLEASESAGDDIYFFQEIAELSSRVKGNFVLIGILHQAFKQYARTQKLTEKTQNDWAKVQGRFVDLPFVTSADEVVKLISNAIDHSENVEVNKKVSESVCTELAKRRPAVSSDLSDTLTSCWPLHPATTLLLGPVSKRQFGQNERSIFGFLGSLEPYGFQEFLRASTASAENYYTPENYWDYLKANVEPAIISSLDSHRWSIAVEALERVEAKGEHFHASLIKNIAIIDLFKNGSGLAADNAMLFSIYPNEPQDRIEQALSDLASWKVIVYRKFNNAWSIFEGSDFDIESAISQELKKSSNLEPKKVTEIAHFHPIIAKRHLYQTGSSRWMGVSISNRENLVEHIKRFQPANGEFGQFVFLIDTEARELRQQYKNISTLVENKKAVFALGAPERNSKILELVQELIALEAVSDRPELAGDAIARKEVATRVVALRNSLDAELANATNNTHWVYCDKDTEKNDGNLSRLASDFADTLYFDTPRIHSELVNRESLSTSSVKARRELLYKMLSDEKLDNLGIDGFPAEKGLYLTCLNATGIHKKRADSEEWYLSEPSESERNLLPAWNAALELVINNQDSVSCMDIYKMWSAPPYGIKPGLMPILLWALVLSNKERLALYKEGYYLPDPTSLDIDVSLQNISKFELKGVQLTEDRLVLLKAISDVLHDYLKVGQLNDALNVAKGLVRIIYNLPGWVRRTRNLSHQAMRFRDCILRASDPHKVLFHELQGIFKTEDVADIALGLRSVLEEITSKQDMLLDSLSSLMFVQLNVQGNDIEKLKVRARNIKNTGKPFVNAFISRLIESDGSAESILDMYGLIVGKSADNWGDQDVQEARNKIAVLAREFRELEVVAQVNQRSPSRQALAIVYGSSPGNDFVTRFDMFEDERSEHQTLSDELVKMLNQSELDSDAQLAVLAQALETLYREKKEKSHG